MYVAIGAIAAPKIQMGSKGYWGIEASSRLTQPNETVESSGVFVSLELSSAYPR
jgi:hypothetical protein